MESNYTKTVRVAQKLFLDYDQDAIIARYGLEHDEDWLYLPFIGNRYRISRENGAIEVLTEAGQYEYSGDFNVVMSIYDGLCYPTETPTLSGEWCQINSLQVTMSSPSANIFNQKYANIFAGNVQRLRRACEKLGGTELPIAAGADVYCQFEVFPFFPIQFRFWDADDEFPAQIRILWDRNSLQFMHFETLYYVMGAFLTNLLTIFQSNVTDD